MKISIFDVTVRGIRPLLMHNGQLADPLNPHAKALKAASKKKTKSDADIEEVYKTEFLGSLYYDKTIGPFIPSDNLQAMIQEGARKRKLGKQVEAMVQVMEPEDKDGKLQPGWKLLYEGPRDPESMFQLDSFKFIKRVRVGMSASVMRTRPRFSPGWSVKFRLEVTEGGPDVDQMKEAISDAGLLIGLGDWAPRYGRFELEKFEAVKHV